jgi:23S rRNA pseudoU1915 N3-methylase RlmH
MFRSMLVSLVMLGVFAGFAAANAEKTVSKDNTDKKAKEAKLVKVDAKKGTVTVKMEIDGKEVEKTFKLAENIEYADSKGKVAVIDIFTSGDLILVVEEDGTISKMKKRDK